MAILPFKASHPVLLFIKSPNPMEVIISIETTGFPKGTRTFAKLRLNTILFPSHSICLMRSIDSRYLTLYLEQRYSTKQSTQKKCFICRLLAFTAILDRKTAALPSAVLFRGSGLTRNVYSRAICTLCAFVYDLPVRISLIPRRKPFIASC